MTTYAYWFPAPTSTYKAKVGDINFMIWYTRDYNSAVYINTDCLDIESLNIPLEVDPSNQSFRYSNMKIKFKYNFVIEAMLADIISQGKQNTTYIDMLINGSLYWRGLLVWENIAKNDYYIDTNGNLLYKSITFDFNDAFYYLSKNNKTLSDASYSDGMTIKALLQNIIALIGFDDPDYLILDSNLKINEECGTSYNLGHIKIKGLNANTLITEFLHNFMVEFAVFIYILKGNVYVVKRNGGSILVVNNSDVMDLQKSVINQIGYVNVYFNLIASDGWPAYGHNPIKKESGTKNLSNTNYNYEIECNYLKKCFTTHNLYRYPGMSQTPTGGGTDYISDTEADFLAASVETGDILNYNSPDLSNIHSFIMKGITKTNLKFYDIGVPVETDLEYYIRTYTAPLPRFKGELLLYMAADTYIDFFLTSPDVFNIILKGISNYDDLSKRYVFNSLNHRARNAIINFIEDTVYMEWMRVS